MSLIYGEYFVNVHFSDIPHTFIPHFTLHSAEKNLHRIFRKLPVDNFPHSAIRIPQNTPSHGQSLSCRTFHSAFYLLHSACRILPIASLIYGEYLVNVHFGDIQHIFMPHFTLHSAEKIIIGQNTWRE